VSGNASLALRNARERNGAFQSSRSWPSACGRSPATPAGNFRGVHLGQLAPVLSTPPESRRSHAASRVLRPSKCRSLCVANKQRELTTTRQLSEVAIEADEVFATLRDGRYRPGVLKVVAAELPVQAEL
jgi:hypothetical protein